jgi:uncharacterized protein
MSLHLSLTTLAQHALCAFLVVFTPAWDYYDTRRLKRAPSSANRIRYYRTTCFWLWVCAMVAVALVKSRSIFFVAPPAYEAAWLFGHLWVRYSIVALLGLLTISVLLPYATVAWKRLTKKPRSYTSAALLLKVSYAYLFPVTRRDRRWWIVVGLTAGICEEIVFRGFLLHYLHVGPWNLNLVVALLLSSVIFAAQHLYQGTTGVLLATVVGMCFGLLFLLSGTLLLPIGLHALMDLRLLVILRPATE